MLRVEFASESFLNIFFSISLHLGSLVFNIETKEDAINKEEYDPTIIPTNKATANS
tara:strand:+ start:443 stop:610 length:168 start_codon:yes stop_codon:yes gene_type:complete